MHLRSIAIQVLAFKPNLQKKGVLWYILRSLFGALPQTPPETCLWTLPGPNGSLIRLSPSAVSFLGVNQK